MVELTEVEKRFVLHWGEMGTRWGINRTVAQIHALLYISEEPLSAGEITDTLDVARSNVSNCLKELESWGILNVVSKIGDRKDYYETYEDVWEMFCTIMEERKKRELDPTLDVLQECVEESETSEKEEEYTRKRLQELLEFMEDASRVADQLNEMDPDRLKKLVGMWDKVKNLLPV